MGEGGRRGRALYGGGEEWKIRRNEGDSVLGRISLSRPAAEMERWEAHRLHPFY